MENNKSKEEPKQETLEEAAEIWVNNRFTKQICGDESYSDIYASKKSIIESHVIFAKSQVKIMYSEENIREAIVKSAMSNTDNLIERCDEIIEQIKTI